MGRMHLEVGFSTDVGRQRQRNEDSYAVFVPFPGDGNPSQLAGMMLVADGMGGERAGDRASQMTSRRLKQWFASGRYREWPEFEGPDALEAALGRAIREVSREIYQLGEDDPQVRGLGSTVVVALLTSKRLILGHVGDSRCYRVRGRTLELLTTDHSWVQRQVDAGVITAEAARTHPQRNILTRSLGDSLPPEVDMVSVDVRDGDVFVLCSDGMTGGVSDAQILQASLELEDPQELADALVRRANDQDGSDNITCVVGRCEELEAAEEAADLETRTTQRLEFDENFHEEETRVNITPPEAPSDDEDDADDDPSEAETRELPRDLGSSG